MEVPISEAKNRLSALLADVARGHEITITKRGVSVAKLVPVAPSFDREQAKRVAAGLREASRGTTLDGIKITPLTPFGDFPPVMSHFGEGVLTFHVLGLFRTDPKVNLWVTGPVNRPKHGIQALTGVVETDWSVASFTMNWKFTAPGVRIRFEKDEPFCFFFPLPRGTLDEIEPEIKSISAAGDDIYGGYTAWRESRSNFIETLNIPGSAAAKARWERTYFQGARPDGLPGPADHQTRIRLKPFKR